ncbi:MAG TPA: hypothetical protein VGM09_12960 [Bradyrhizobium sp.]|jgi:hypothetical protein
MTGRAASTGKRSCAEPQKDIATLYKDIDTHYIDIVLTLAIDTVQKTQSGHAGTPMGLAAVCKRAVA